METENKLSVSENVVPLSVQMTGDEFARVNADGTCEVNWERCEQVAAQWKPHGEIYQAVAKLLIYVRDQSHGNNS